MMRSTALRKKCRAAVAQASFCCLFISALTGVAAEHQQVLSRGSHHLRSGRVAEWDEFKRQNPDGAGIDVRFNAKANSREATLLITQDNVKQDWRVLLNDKRIGSLFLMEAPLVHLLTVPVGGLQDGPNVLSIVAPETNDDVVIGEILLDERPAKEVLSESGLDVQVTERDTGAALPCRVTILDERGSLVPLAATPGEKSAVRPGVVYTATGQTRVGLQPGKHMVHVTRGFEFSLATAQVTVRSGETARLALELRRDVPTPGLVCSDTHIHTGTYARHGDATIDERVITLAGEGIELPVSTEHECLVDYTGPAYRAGVQDWFTPVIGDEVTTTKGHFNIFPINFRAPSLPDKRITDWPELMRVFRGTPGVQVVVLNHPRNIHNGFQPFASTNFNVDTGENLRGFEFTFDAIEVANSSAMQSDWMISFRDWFALLNYGHRVTGLGSSDGHDVSRYIVGQGRTYILCADGNPARIDVNEACASLKEGRALVSLGLLANMEVNGRFKVGDLATDLGEQFQVHVTVLGPSWVTADRVQLFANGIQIREEQLGARSEAGQSAVPLRREIFWSIPSPKHDVHLIALATGPGVREQYWSLARPYQPSSSNWDPRVIGATNPIWIDADRDGRFTAARGYAQRLLQEHHSDSDALQAALRSYDQAVAAQVASLRSKGTADRAEGLRPGSF